MASPEEQIKTEVIVQNSVADYYENVRYRRHYSRAYHEWWVGKMLSYVEKDGTILDNGCGNGFLFTLLRRNDMFGLDISWNMINKAKIRNPKVVLGDSNYLPFSSTHFDVVFCRGLLHHLNDPLQGIMEVHRVLKLDGEVVLVDTNESIISKIPRLLARTGSHFSQHHKNFNRKDYITLISSKFKVEKVAFFGYIAYPLLGFPDVLDVFRFFPLQKRLCSLLIRMDEFLSRVPLINIHGWAILVKARKLRT
jgi:SAM-dependent methyltransferase